MLFKSICNYDRITFYCRSRVNKGAYFTLATIIIAVPTYINMFRGPLESRDYNISFSSIFCSEFCKGHI